MFKKLAKKVAQGVKEGVQEETGKTVEELKESAKKTCRDILPMVLGALAVIAVVALLRRPTPVVVKIVMQAV